MSISFTMHVVVQDVYTSFIQQVEEQITFKPLSGKSELKEPEQITLIFVTLFTFEVRKREQYFFDILAMFLL